MVKIKIFILSADFVCLSASGYSFIDIINTFLSGNLAMSSFDNFVKLLLSMGGFVYLCVRIYNTIMMASLDRRLKEQEIIEKQNENRKNNPYRYMKSKLTEDNHENLKK